MKDQEQDAMTLDGEARFRRLLESLPTVAVQGYALDGTVRYWNRASELFYGYTENEAIGRNLLDLIIPPEMCGGVGDALRQMAETGEPLPAAEILLMRKDGSRIPVYSSHAVILDPGGEIRLYCIDVDLTERKQADAALRESEARLRLALEVAQMGHWRYDCATNSVEWFSGHDVLFGIPRDQFGGTLDAVQERVHPDDRAHGIVNLRRTIMTGVPFDNTYRVIHSGGIVQWLHSYGHLFRDERGQPKHIFGVTQNITERKLREMELDRQHRRLRELADDLTKTEERQRRDIALRLHDGVGQLLTVAIMKLNEAESEADDATGRDKLGGIRRLMEQALADTRLLTGELSPPLLHESGLISGLSWLLEQFRKQHPSLHFELTREAEPQSRDCRVLFYQIARELLFNAIKHAQAGYVGVSLEAEDGGGFSMRVWDDGIGGVMAETLDCGQGTGGFGLFSIRERIELFGGEVIIESPAGGGTSVTVISPCCVVERASS